MKKHKLNSLIFNTLVAFALLSAFVGVSYASGTSNFNTTRNVIAPTYDAYPNKGELRNDPITGAGITRIADHTELTGNYNNSPVSQALIVYSRYTPTNITNEFVLIHGTDSTSCWVYRLSDNSMRTVLRIKPSLGTASRALGEINELRWDYSGAHPYRLYFVGRSISNSQAISSENVNTSFYYIDLDPVTGTQSAPVLIHDFAAEFPVAGTYPAGGYSNASIMNDVEGDSSNDSRYWAFQIMDTSLGTGYKPYAIITYDKQTNTVLGRLQRNCVGVKGVCTVLDTPATSLPYLSRPNMVEISPLGTRIVVDWGRRYTGNLEGDIGTVADGPHAFLKDFTDPIRIGADETHSGWAWGPNGEEMFVSQNNRNDYIEAVDIATSTTANCTVISGNNYSCGIKVIAYSDLDMGNWSLGMHFGKVYDQAKRGWFFMNTSDKDYITWGKNQNLFVEIKPYNDSTVPVIWRIIPSYNVHYDYRSEGSGALSFDGTVICATTNWGYTDGRAEPYSIGLPNNWYEHFNGTYDTTAPTVTTFNMPATSTSLSVPISSLTATDNIGVTSYLVTEVSTPPSVDATGWSASSPISFIFSGVGTKTAYAWAKDAAGNLSNGLGRTVTIALPDTTAPAVTAFTMPAKATSLTVAISGLTATDNIGVSGYLVTENATVPTASAAGWSSSAPTSFTFSGSGSKTAYAWAKDAAGNVSSSRSAAVTIILSDTKVPVVSAFTMPSKATSLTVAVTAFTASDAVGVTGYMITESSARPAASASRWTASAPSSFTFSSAGTKKAYAWAKDAAGNVSSSRYVTVTIRKHR